MARLKCPHCGETGNIQDTNDKRKCLSCGGWSTIDGKKLKHKARGGATYMTSQMHPVSNEEVGD